jgi:hypothetical protein
LSLCHKLHILHRKIERYTIKFSPALNQKEPEKALHESGDLSHTHHLKGAD